VEDVTVEADGEWHTADGKYGSEGWKSSHPPLKTTETLPPRKSSITKTPPSSKPPATRDWKAKENDFEIVVLDSDDEDEGRVKRELSPSFGRSSSMSGYQSFEGTITSQSQQSQADNVIDLTLDSDDDEPPAPRKAGKRKATDAEMSPTEQIWKKGRQAPESTPVMPAANGHVTDAALSNFDAYPQYPNRSHTTSHTQYINPYPATSPTLYSYHVPGTSMTDNPSLSVGRNPYVPRINARWPGT
jgi:E3 SUMO-protein ligase PIAS1